MDREKQQHIGHRFIEELQNISQHAAANDKSSYVFHVEFLPVDANIPLFPYRVTSEMT